MKDILKVVFIIAFCYYFNLYGETIKYYIGEIISSYKISLTEKNDLLSYHTKLYGLILLAHFLVFLWLYNIDPYMSRLNQSIGIILYL